MQASARKVVGGLFSLHVWTPAAVTGSRRKKCVVLLVRNVRQEKGFFMASINYAAKEISVKIVYYGPGLSGKTTNLQVIHRKTPPTSRSDMVSLATETDRTLFFDFLPIDLGTIKGFATKFQLYTVPGQVYYNATRKLVLRGVDGLVFVADSAADKMQENMESFQNLEDNLAEYGYKRENIPIVLQYNKRDLPNALPVEEIDRIFNKYHCPWNEAIASKSKGVFESLKMIGKLVIDNLNRKYNTSSVGSPLGARAGGPLTGAQQAQAQQRPAAAPQQQFQPMGGPGSGAPAPQARPQPPTQTGMQAAAAAPQQSDPMGFGTISFDQSPAAPAPQPAQSHDEVDIEQFQQQFTQPQQPPTQAMPTQPQPQQQQWGQQPQQWGQQPQQWQQPQQPQQAPQQQWQQPQQPQQAPQQQWQQPQQPQQAPQQQWQQQPQQAPQQQPQQAPQ
jgi:mutual gliding-motility protein MglA